MLILPCIPGQSLSYIASSAVVKHRVEVAGKRTNGPARDFFAPAPARRK